MPQSKYDYRYNPSASSVNIFKREDDGTETPLGMVIGVFSPKSALQEYEDYMEEYFARGLR